MPGPVRAEGDVLYTMLGTVMAEGEVLYKGCVLPYARSCEG